MTPAGLITPAARRPKGSGEFPKWALDQITPLPLLKAYPDALSAKLDFILQKMRFIEEKHQLHRAFGYNTQNILWLSFQLPRGIFLCQKRSQAFHGDLLVFLDKRVAKEDTPPANLVKPGRGNDLYYQKTYI
jgi:hypothetical protein